MRGRRSLFSYNYLREPPTPSILLWPAVNLALLGLPIFGYTLLASSLDHARWRPTSIGSVLTLGGMIAYVVSMIPVFRRIELEAMVGAGVHLQVIQSGRTGGRRGDAWIQLFGTGGDRGRLYRSWHSWRSRSAICRPMAEGLTACQISKPYDDAVVGAGILGLAHAYHLARRGRRVIVFDRNPRAIGASIRNFGMLWPIGQPFGPLRRLALRSVQIWLEVLESSSLWHERTGSLHLAYRDDEAQVLREFARECAGHGEPVDLLTPQQVRGADDRSETSWTSTRAGKSS